MVFVSPILSLQPNYWHTAAYRQKHPANKKQNDISPTANHYYELNINQYRIKRWLLWQIL
jgi:hypothetical protein